MRRLSFVVLLAVLAGLFALPTAPARAATFRNLIAQIPATPTSGEPVRVWMQSDTAFGETAFIEYNLVGTGTYVKVPGSFDTSGPAPANWRADIPAQAAGTAVRYQLLTRNEFGQDYGFTGFNWSYTVQSPVGDIRWDEVLHDSFSADYRSPGGPVAKGTTVRLRLRTAQGDITGARVRLWDDRANVESFLPMSWDGAFDTDPVTYDWWVVDLPTGADPTVLYYFFELNDNGDQDFYVDDDPKFYGGGLGAMSDGWDDSRGFQITAYDPIFDVPEWMQQAIVYQIFPDRFRDGDSTNNPVAGRFSYGANVGIVRSNQSAWNSTVCDPRGQQGPGFNCPDRYGDNFYGGDLAGVTQKIADGYLSSLGVTVVYLNPIFRAPSNHKYDTANFLEIDPDFGTLAEFQALVAAADARGIRIMLDGVFNHTSSDSPYFDRYGRYGETGACEATAGSPSPYSSWFYFPAFANPGSDGGVQVICQNGQTYEAWYGYSSLPKLNSSLPEVRNYFYGDENAVGPYWTREGASGWRFDVGADVDAGVTNTPTNSYWEEFRAAVRDPALTGKSDVVMLGEEWGDASAWLLGNEWDSVMNYRFRSAVLGWLFTGCSGNGCTGGTKFQENDSNDNSSSGAIAYVSPSQFNARLRSIQEDYPPMAFRAMMNLAGSHDTQRLRFLLKKINGDSDAAAVQRMQEWWLFAFTYAGAPTLYYGDEVGLSHDGVWDGSQYQDDPYNRAPFPWPDASGSSYTPDSGLQSFARHMASVRQSYAALQDGEVQHGLVIDDARQLYGFARTNGAQTALVLLNRGGATHSATFSGLNAAPYNLPDGAELLDAIGGATYTVSGGAVTVSATPSWGAVLLEPGAIDAPAAPAGLSAAASGADVALSWQAVTSDSAGAPELATRYELFRGGAGFTPSAASRIATLAPPSFGGPLAYSDAGAAAGGPTYIVRACNAAGSCADTPPVTVPAGPSYSFSGFFPPVDNLPVINRVQAGRAIPVKFSLGGDLGLNIFAADHPLSRPVTCDGSATSDPVEQTVSAAASSLSYDAATGVYTYVWKTEKAWRGCRELLLRFGDGSEQRARFNFR
jgi:glycosidase